MYTEGFEQWFKMGNQNNSFSEFNKTATEMCRKATQQNVELFGENVSRYSDRLKQLTSLRNPQDLLTFHKECINEDISVVMNTMQKFMQTYMSNIENLTNLCTQPHEAPKKSPDNRTTK